MIRPIAILDTDVLIWLLDNSNDSGNRQKRSFTKLTIENLQKQHARFYIPAPAIAELSRNGPGSEVLRELARDTLKHLHIEVLDEDAADIAGAISRTRLTARAGRERGAVKYDSLIAGIAHRVGARWLVTANGKDMQQCLAVINSGVEVVIATEQPATGQRIMVAVLEHPSPKAPDAPVVGSGGATNTPPSLSPKKSR